MSYKTFVSALILASKEVDIIEKMCPLYPFHVIILYLCLLLPLLFAVIEGADELAGLKKWNLKFIPDKVEKLEQYNFTEVKVNCENCNTLDDPGSLQLVLKNEKPNIASLDLKVHLISLSC